MTKLDGRLTMVLVAVGAMLVAASAEAQPGRGPGGRGPGGRGPGGGMMGNPAMLLGSEQVQKELELVPDQIAQLQGLRDKMREEFRDLFSGMRDMTPEEREKRMQEVRDKMQAANEKLTKQIDEILLPHQKERLQQIRVQMLGDRALGDAEVIKALGLTETQQKKLTEIGEKARAKMQEMFSGIRDLEPEQRREAFSNLREKMTQVREAAQKEAQAVLTAEQIEKLKKLRGEPFEFQRPERRPGARGPGGRPAGGQRPGGPPPAP